jgi:hypothetical protein
MPSRADAERRYEAYRNIARSKAEELMQTNVAPTPLRLTAIGPAALDACHSQWEPQPTRRLAWSWPRIIADARRHHPTRFEVAVWSGDVLCGLAWGRTGANYCSVNYLEGSPLPNHPLKGSVAVVVSGAMATYATALERPEIRFLEPLPEVVRLYQSLGFTLANPPKQPPYCSRRLP